jgi:hypothetical protein
MELLFHKDVFIPDEIKNKAIEIEKNLKSADMRLSNHVEEWCRIQERYMNYQSDRHDYSHGYTKAELRSVLDQIQDELPIPFEIQVNSFSNDVWVVTKIVVRTWFNKHDDISVAIATDCTGYGDSGSKYIATIKTAWLNNMHDSHFSLDTIPYCNEARWNKIEKEID